MKQKYGFIIYSGSDKVGTIKIRKGSLEITLTVLLKYPPLFKKNEKTKNDPNQNEPTPVDGFVCSRSLSRIACHSTTRHRRKFPANSAPFKLYK